MVRHSITLFVLWEITALSTNVWLVSWMFLSSGVRAKSLILRFANGFHNKRSWPRLSRRYVAKWVKCHVMMTMFSIVLNRHELSQFPFCSFRLRVSWRRPLLQHSCVNWPCTVPFERTTQGGRQRLKWFNDSWRSRLNWVALLSYCRSCQTIWRLHI
jgi:hypothetical protein